MHAVQLISSPRSPSGVGHSLAWLVVIVIAFIVAVIFDICVRLVDVDLARAHLSAVAKVVCVSLVAVGAETAP
jgi:hypothetical protein